MFLYGQLLFIIRRSQARIRFTPTRRAVLATLSRARSFISRISHHILLSHIHIYIFHIYISMGIARLLGATAIGATAAPHHILCLHGGGTNAAIMKLQTSKLRHQLRDFAGKGSNQALAEPT